MSSTVPPDGVYHVQNAGYPDQMMGLELRIGGLGLIVAGRHEDSRDPHIEWQVKATRRGEHSTITMKSDSKDASDFYIGVASGTVGYSSAPYEWELSYRDSGRCVIGDPTSGLVLFLPSSEDRTPVLLMGDGAGEGTYWRFIPN